VPKTARVMICERPISKEGMDYCPKVIVPGVNCVAPHVYLDYGPNEKGGRIGVGVFNTDAKEGSLPEEETNLPVLKPTKCTECVKADFLRLMHGKGERKLGSEATNAEIWDCIKKHPLSRDYSVLGYNCS